MITKNLFEKSLLGGICLGLCLLGSTLVEFRFLQGVIVSLGFLGAMESGFPIITEKFGDARVMTTFMGYPSPNVLIFNLLIKKVFPGNLLGILLSIVIGRFVLGISEIEFKIEDNSWWEIFISSILAGILINFGTSNYYKKKVKWLVIVSITLTTSLNLNHTLIDFGKVLLSEDPGLWILLKLTLISLCGNFIGSRFRTLITNDEDEKDN